jgi:hypothetical protein
MTLESPAAGRRAATPPTWPRRWAPLSSAIHAVDLRVEISDPDTPSILLGSASAGTPSLDGSSSRRAP